MDGGIPVNATDYVAIAALLVSLTSLGFSIYFGFLDRSHLKASSKYNPEWEHSSAHITVSAVNHGRRPIILTLFGGTYEDGNWEGTSLEKDRAGLRLDENERFQETIRSGHDMLHSTLTGSRITDLWFQDTLGRRYKVKNSKKNVKLFWRNDSFT